LPKLNTQFISFADYLWRNWELLRSESSYEIRLDIVDALRRLQPTVRLQFDDIDDSKQVLSTDFAGWARMAIPNGKEMVKIVQVLKPRLGQKYPSQVLAEVTIDLKPYAQSLRQEWDSLREYDNIFLLAVDASKMQSKESRIDDTNDPDFPQRYGLSFVRGCMIQSVRDESGSVISDPSNKEVSPVGTKRTFLVALDPTQYTKDQQLVNVYDTFNIVVRRHGKANNFRSVLESVRSLMTGVGSIPRVMPKWMQSVLLGHSTDQACFRSETMRNFARSTAGVPNPDAFFDFCDTFVDWKHLVETLQSMAKNVSVDGEDTTADQEPNVPPNCNFRVRVVDDKTAEAVSYPKPEGSVGNTIRFTPRQVDAIRAGLSPGLSLVVGPPGTGKCCSCCTVSSADKSCSQAKPMLLFKSLPACTIHFRNREL
jgi:intron-binding protein aquarius